MEFGINLCHGRMLNAFAVDGQGVVPLVPCDTVSLVTRGDGVSLVTCGDVVSFVTCGDGVSYLTPHALLIAS